MNHHCRATAIAATAGLVSILIVLCCASGAATGAEPLEPSLVRNGDMETGNPPECWKAESGALVAADADCHSGKQSLRVSVTGGKATQAFPVKPGTRYKLEFWYKCAPLLGRLYVYVSDGGPANLTGDLASEDVWSHWIGEFKTAQASTATRATVGIVTMAGKDVLIDDVSIVEIGPAPQPSGPSAPEQVGPPQQPATREQALESWRAQFPGRSYVCWEKSPWGKLVRTGLPPAAVTECRAIRLALGVNEYESASFVVTNLSDTPLDLAVSTRGARVPVTVRVAAWVTTCGGVEVNDALPLLAGKLRIPSGESREVWLTLHSRGVTPGEYDQGVTLAQRGLPSTRVDLKLKVYPVSLPEDKPIYTYYWDYVVPGWTGPAMARALVKDMKEHYVNVPVVHPWASRLQLDPDGTLMRDYTELDTVLRCYRALKPRMLLFAWNDALLTNIAGYPFFSDTWKALFASYITGMVQHLQAEGWGYDTFAIVPYDERLDKPVYNMAKLIKEIDPRIRICVNATGTRFQAEAIAPYVDIWCPDLYDYLSPATPYTEKNQNPKLLPKGDQFFWTYANPPGGHAQEASPYIVYRLALWKAFEAGMSGFGYWVYSYKTHWNSLNHADGENWAVVYLANAKDAPAGLSRKELVVPSKRWEATREGVEEYAYLRMLRDALARSQGSVAPGLLSQAAGVLADGPKTVLASPTDPGLADAAKEEVLKVLSGLK
jgi:hypothetical protein